MEKPPELPLQLTDEAIWDLYNQAPCGFHSLNAEGTFIQINETELSWLGYSRDEVVGKLSVFNVLTPAGVQDFRANFQLLQKSGRLKDVEFELVRKDGSSFTVIVNAIAVRSPSGAFLMSRSTLFDISDRKLLIAGLRESEERYRGLYESTQDGIARIDLQGRYLDCNNAFAKLLGYTKEEILHLNFEKVTPEHGKKRDRDVFEKQLLKRGYTDVIEKEYLRKDGTLIPVSTRAWAIRGPEGALIGGWVIVRDMSERRKIEEALRQSEYELKEAQRVAQVGSWELTYETNTTRWSEEIYRIFGIDPKLPPPQLLEHPEFFSPESLARLNFVLKRMRTKGIPYSLDIEIRRPDGGRRWIASRGELKKDNKNRVIGTRGTAQDITERKRLEQELSRSNADLAQYASIVSHDLREPIRMVQSYTQILERKYKGRLDENADRYIKYIIDGSQRMADLVSDLLAYARAGKSQISRDRVDLNQVVQSTLVSLGKTIDETHARVELMSLPTLSADKSQIAQLFQNLIDNAIKFRREGQTPRIRISAKPLKENPADWMISIEDNGIGIGPEYSDRVFMIFQRLHERGRYPGTGIGLAICKKIVERHGGRIWFTPNTTGGATFHFTIPTGAEDGVSYDERKAA